MSDEEKNAGDAGAGTAKASEPAEQPFSDEHTTEPNAPALPQQAIAPGPMGKWQMPKPKFQQTSGYLPQGYLKDVEAAAAAAKPGSEDTTQEQAAFVPQARETGTPAVVPDIEPQPDLADQLIPDESIEQTTAQTRAEKGGSSLPMMILGLIAILIFAAAFLAAVYFLFLAKPVESPF